MKQYFCYVIDQEGHVSTREIFEGSHDNEVFGIAQSYLAEHPSMPAVEIWLEDRYVGKLHQPLARNVPGSLAPSYLLRASTAALRIVGGSEVAKL